MKAGARTSPTIPTKTFYATLYHPLCNPVVSTCKLCDIIGISSVSIFVSPIPKILHLKIPEIEEEACEVKPLQLSVRFDHVNCAPVKPRVYQAFPTYHLGFPQLVVICICVY